MKKAYDQLFIDSAIHVVAQVGIENARTKQMADQAGFSEATLFRAFSTKEDILRSAFLHIDKKLSDILTKSEFVNTPGTISFEDGLRSIWHDMYRYLISNKEETIFLIRYRYSALYTEDVRSCRQAYNGGFDGVYEVLERANSKPAGTYRGFLVNYMFEMTLCFAEKIITGRITDTPETERRIWTAIASAVRAVLSSEE